MNTCQGTNGEPQYLWIRLVGLALDLWSDNIFKVVGEKCGGPRIDNDAKSRAHLK